MKKDFGVIGTLRRVQAEMSLFFVFPDVVRIEKTYAVFGVLDQRTDLT